MYACFSLIFIVKIQIFSAALCAFLVYIIIIVDCSYPESGQLILKALILVVIVTFFGTIVPILVMQPVRTRNN